MPPQTPKQPEPSLEKHTVWLMIAVAFFYDIVSLLLPSITSPVAALHFLLWFKLHDVSFVKPKRIAAGVLGFFIELLPFSSWFLGWTATVAYIAWGARRKDAVI